MKKSLLSVLYMVSITFAFTLLVSAVKYFTEGRIESNQTVKLQRIILEVLEIAVPEDWEPSQVSRLFTSRVREIELQDRIFYIGFEADGLTVKGYAFPVGGAGFWGPIMGMAGVNPDASRLTGIAFIKHSETPGLGGRITEKWFSDQFKGLPLFPVSGGKKIFTLKIGASARADNELDGITGATNTTAAVERFLNRDLNSFLKEYWNAVKKKE